MITQSPLQPFREISVLAIGSELLDSRVHESNGYWIAGRLATVGQRLVQSLTCDDNVEIIVESLEYLYRRATTVIVSGGLGPTSDDLTRKAVATYFGCSLSLNVEALEDIRALFARRNRTFDPSNEIQAYIPSGATIVKNPMGTAPGFLLESTIGGRLRTVVALPGIPSELHRMWQESVEPILITNENGPRECIKVIRSFGIPESTIGTRVQSCAIPSDITVSYQVSFPEVAVRLRAPSSREAELSEWILKVQHAVGPEYIFSTSQNETFEESLSKTLLVSKKTIAVGESCTGGYITGLFTNPPGASAYLLGGVVAYDNSIKKSLLDVAPTLLVEFGAVSHEVARAMAEGVRIKFNSDIGVSVTGIAGPDGGSDEKPVGTIYIGLSTSLSVLSFRFFLPRTRAEIRRFASYKALDIVRRHLLGYEIRGE